MFEVLQNQKTKKQAENKILGIEKAANNTDKLK